MITRKTTITILILTLLAPSVAVYTYGNYNNKQISEIEKIAINYLLNCPTFKFDGIIDSIEILDYVIMESYPEQHVITIAFKTTHSGWGDRTGTFCAEVITPHIIRITIVEEKALRAIIDNKWDEIKQEQIIPEELVAPTDARDKVIEYIIQKNQELSLEVPGSWLTEMTCPSEIIGKSTIRYLGGKWEVVLTYPIVRYPEYVIDVLYSGDTSFIWSGLVNNSGTIIELNMDL
jgi:hypothetical protein